MYFLYVAKIYLLTLLKISYEALIAAAIILSLMTIISFMLGDKYYFTKKINNLKRYIYGEL